MCEISEALRTLEKQFKEDVSQNKTRQKETFGAILSEVQTKFEAMQTESQSHFDQMRDEYFRKVHSVHDQIVAHQKQSEAQIQADQAQWDQKLKTIQAEMEAVTQQIAEAKQKWADEQKQIQARTLDQSEIVSLNVGGQKGIQVSRALLTQEPETGGHVLGAAPAEGNRRRGVPGPRPQDFRRTALLSEEWPPDPGIRQQVHGRPVPSRIGVLGTRSVIIGIKD